jgi:hypothetical protein
MMEGGKRKGEGELADKISFFPPSEALQEPLVFSPICVANVHFCSSGALRS